MKTKTEKYNKKSLEMKWEDGGSERSAAGSHFADHYSCNVDVDGKDFSFDVVVHPFSRYFGLILHSINVLLQIWPFSNSRR